jgi:hypothetical protein
VAGEGKALGILAKRLTAGGWEPDDQRMPIVFRRALEGGFAATVRISARERPNRNEVVDSARDLAGAIARGTTRALARKATRGHWPARRPLQLTAHLALDYEPASAVLAALRGDSRRRVALDSRALTELASGGDSTLRRVAAAFAEQIEKRADSQAARYAEPDAFLAALPAERLEEIVSFLIARTEDDEAREALERGSARATEDRRRFIRQATRLLDGEVTLAELTTTVAPPREPIKLEFRKARASGRAARDALDAVAEKPASSRDGRRAQLLAELARRGASMSPSAIEQDLDRFEPGYQKPSAIRAARALRSAFKAIKDAPNSPTIDPPWMLRPAAATYKLNPQRSRRVGVAFDAGIEDWLDGAYAAASRRDELPSIGIESVRLDVWFSPAAEDGGPAVVSIGEQRIGTVEPQGALAPAMAAAALRDELPWAVATLTRRRLSPRYVLEFRVPA